MMHLKNIAARSLIDATVFLCLVGILTAEETSRIAQDKVVGTIVIPGAKAVTCQINSDCPTGFTCAVIPVVQPRQGVCTRGTVLCRSDANCLSNEYCIHGGNPPAPQGQCNPRASSVDLSREAYRHQR